MLAALSFTHAAAASFSLPPLTNPMVPPMDREYPPPMVPMMPEMSSFPWRSADVQMWVDEEARASGIDPDYLEHMETKAAHICQSMNMPMPQQCWENGCMPIENYLALLEETVARSKAESLLQRYA